MINLKLLGDTKLRILLMLRRTPRTIHELAQTLGVTDNAVRAHVTALERDRLVEPEGRRPGIRKPAVTYDLSPVGDQMFAKPYAQVLTALAGEIRERHGDAELEAIAREIGSKLARERGTQVAGLAGKATIEAVATLINDLGGLAEVEEADGAFVINGYSCPLIAVVGSHPQVCKLTQAFIEELIGGATVRERCQRSGPRTCRFEIDLATPLTETSNAR